MKKKITEKKNLTVIKPVRFTEEEIKKLSVPAVKLNIGVSTLIRKLATKKDVKFTSYTDKQTIAQIRKIGVNINQVAKRVNTLKQKINFTSELVQINEELKFLHEIIKNLKNE